MPVCIETPMADVSSIEPCDLRATPARSVSSGAMDAVARTFKTIHLSQRGPMLRADACLGIGQRVCQAFCNQAQCCPANARSAQGPFATGSTRQRVRPGLLRPESGNKSRVFVIIAGPWGGLKSTT